jgi:hypothetical protein
VFDGEDLRVDCSNDCAEFFEVETEAGFDHLVVVVDGVTHEDDWAWIAVLVSAGEDAPEHVFRFVHANKGCAAELEGLWMSFTEFFVDEVGVWLYANMVVLHTREDTPW